jgi:hypothetical protein
MALLPVVSGCGAAERSTSKTPWCVDWGTVMLEAQSVPSAQLLPCVSNLPAGWSPGRADIGDDGTVFTMHSDIGGDDALTVMLGESCDVTTFARVPSDEPGADRFESIEQIAGGFSGSRAYVFDGGCLQMEFSFDAGVGATLVNEATLMVDLVPRTDVAAVVADISGGREQLDPPPAG